MSAAEPTVKANGRREQCLTSYTSAPSRLAPACHNSYTGGPSFHVLIQFLRYFVNIKAVTSNVKKNSIATVWSDVMIFVVKMTFRMSQSFRTLKHRFTWKSLANSAAAEVTFWNIQCVLFQEFLTAFSWPHTLAHFKTLTLYTFSDILILEKETRPNG